MNEAPVLISIQWIGPNPYQVRHAEDPQAVAELAENIERNSLLQPPTVRKPAGPNNYHELAFGHTRLAAFKLLASQGKTEFEQMPCFVRELDNLQMFEMAVAENIKRRDLNPIERAQAMRTYMDGFDKTSKETGEFFNCDEATVRGSVRLLGLPETVQTHLASGELTVGAGRQLLTLERIAPEAVETVMVRVLNGGDPAVEMVTILEKTKTAVILQDRYHQKNEPTAGEGLWKLSLTAKKFPALPLLTIKDAQDAGAVGKEGGKRKDELKGWINQLEGGLVAAEALIAQGAPAETIEKLEHLVNPPACEGCSYHIAANNIHACGWKACWNRKLAAWANDEAEKLSKKLGIAVYDPGQDGEFVTLNNSWRDEEKKLFTDRIPGLRLKTNLMSYANYSYTSSKLVQLVDVTPEHVQAKKDEEAKRQETASHQDEEREQRNRENKLRAEIREHSQWFAEAVAIPIFASVLEVIKNGEVLKAMINEYTLKDLLSDKDGKPVEDAKQRIQLMRGYIAEEMLENIEAIGYQSREDEGPEILAGELQEVAVKWGVSLPENWMELARKAANTDVPEEDEDQDNDE